MSDKNLLLYLPFDDPDGNKAHDYSAGRNDATLSNGSKFTTNARVGKAVEICGGEIHTSQSIPFDKDFTLSLFVRVSSEKIHWLLNLSDGVIEEDLNITSGTWCFVAFIRNGSQFKVFLDNQCAFNRKISDNPIGLFLDTDTDDIAIDEVRLYESALSDRELIKSQANTDVEYYIDGINFKEYGVYVSSSNGLVGRLAYKDTLTADYNNYHGIARDRKNRRYKERTISLQCFIEAKSRSLFVSRMNEFLSLFDGDYSHRLTVEYDGIAKPLVYQVDLNNEVDPDKKWGCSNNDTMIGKFTLKLVEDEPVKKVLRHISNKSQSEITITVTTNKLLNIYWGDGTHTFNIGGNNTTIKHTYAKPGDYIVIITGVIEDIEAFTTNAIVVWDLLK